MTCAPSIPEDDLLSGLYGRLADSIDLFLEKWPAKVKKTGYFEFTTAIREDWAQAFEGVVLHILNRIQNQGLPRFAELVGRHRSRKWAEFLVREARRHRHRGVTAEMFMVCFKCLIQAVEEIIDQTDAPVRVKYEAVTSLRLFFDAMECCFVGDWTESLKDNALSRLQKTNRHLTLEKNKYVNIFDTTSDLVLVTDQTGQITEANAAAKEQFDRQQVIGAKFWELLGMEGGDIKEVLKYYPLDQTYEISLGQDSQFFILKITHFTKVSKTTGGYMLILSNISCLVDKRERLEEQVEKRTQALVNSETQFRALFQAAGEGILLVNAEMTVVEANERACHIFEYPYNQMVGQDCRHFTEPDEGQPLLRIMQQLSNDQIWTGELKGKCSDRRIFPMHVTINCVALDNQVFYHIIVKDITRQKALEDNLMVEKHRLEEMNVTLRNVMKAIDKEKNALESSITQKIKTLLLPSMEKLRQEPSREIRDSYLNIIQGQLINLTQNSADEYEPRFLRLTRTENRICQLIQAGLSSKEIALNLCISYETIQTHRKNIRRKLGLRGRDVNLYTFLSRRNAVKNIRV